MLKNEEENHQGYIFSPTNALVSCLKKAILKFTLKFYIKTAPTFFDVTVAPSSGSALTGAY